MHKKQIRGRISTGLLTASLVAALSITALATSFSYSSISSNWYKLLFSGETLTKNDEVAITQEYATILSTGKDAATRYVLARTDNGVFIDYDYLTGEDSTTLFVDLSNVSTKLTVYNDEDSAIKVKGAYSY